MDVGLIPAGAREIRIEEVAEAANFLALRSEDPEKYFLNGGWTIQWNGDYQVAGTTFTYARTGNWENLTSPGPTDEPVWIQVPTSRGSGWGAGAGPEGSGSPPSHGRTRPRGLCPSAAPGAGGGWVGSLGDGCSGWVEGTPCAHGASIRLPPPQLLFQESNPGVRYEYTIHREADGPGPVEPPEFSWSYGPWTQCTVTCGTGEGGVGTAAAHWGLYVWAVVSGALLQLTAGWGATMSLECGPSGPPWPRV